MIGIGLKSNYNLSFQFQLSSENAVYQNGLQTDPVGLHLIQDLAWKWPKKALEDSNLFIKSQENREAKPFHN